MGVVVEQLRKWIDSGAARATTDRKRYQTRASNLVGLMFSVMSAPYIPLEYLMGSPVLALLTTISCFVYPLALPLNHYGYSRSARAVPLVAACCMVWVAAVLLTPASQVQLGLFMVALWAFTLYDAREEWPHLVGLQLLPIALYFSINAGWLPTFPGWVPSPNLIRTYAWAMPSTTISLNALVLFVFYFRNQANEDRLIASVEGLNEAHQRAALGEKTKAEFLAVMTHEIRTPLNGVLGCAELIKTEPLSLDQHYWLRTLTNSGEYLLDLMTNILEYSRLDAGESVLREADVDLAALVNDTVETFAEAAASKRLELWCETDPSIPARVTVDAGRLRLVVSNLVSNAVKYTASGYVAVALKSTEGLTHEGAFEITVSDTGPGIDASAHKLIFERFRQLDDFGHRRAGGVGLGLSICKSIADLMKGTLTLESAPGRGSTFKLALAVRVAAAAPTSNRNGHRHAEVFAKRVRVATVNPTFGTALRHQLRNWGHPIVHLDGDADIVLVDERLAPNGNTSGLLRTTERAILLGNGNAGKQARVPRVRRFLRQDDWVEAVARVFDLIPVTSRSALQHSAPALPRNPSPSPALSEQHPLPSSTLSSELGPTESASQTSRNGSVSSTKKQAQTILIADDQPTNQRILQKLAERFGEKVIVVENGALALQAWAEHAPDVILMDIQMPVMDGLEATRAIRAREGARHTPIIAVTANALPEQRAEGLAAGLDAYLTKPVRAAELREAIERFCPAVADSSPVTNP